MEKQKNQDFTLDDVVYTFRVAPFRQARQRASDLIALLKGAVGTKEKADGRNTIDVDIGRIVANLGSEEMDKVENFIMQFLEAKIDGKTILFKNEANVENHFNQYRNHYFRLIFEGVKFHFFTFFPDGGKSLKNISLQQMAELM